MSTGSPALKVAGIGQSWDEGSALAYAEKLTEMGFCAKRYDAGGGRFLVGYSYRPFTVAELEAVLEDLTTP